jgi:hypothetical protein
MTLTPMADVPWTLSNHILLQPIAFALLVGRDCALALFFAFSPYPRRPVMSFAVLMLVVYALLPWLLNALGGQALASMALPLLIHGATSMAIAAGHLGLALWLLHWRWQATAPSNTKG